MSKSTILLTTSMALLAAMIMAQDASATGTKEAIRLCEKNPNCTLVEVNGKETIMVVKGNKGGKSRADPIRRLTA